MCRSIKTLRRPSETPSDEEISTAALQFVRKISGYRQPSKVNEAAFNTAVVDIARASRRMLDSLIARSLAGKPLAWFRATPTRRIPVLHDMLVYVIRFTNPLLHR